MSNSTDKELNEMLYEKAPELTDVEHLKLRDAIQAYVNNAVVAEFNLVNSKLEGLSATSFIKWRNEHETELKSKANN